METRLLDLLVCPLCKGRLYANAAHTELTCRGDRLAFAVRDGIPVMLAEQARSLSSADESATGAQADFNISPPNGGTTPG
jgi:uncharacterized protein YbaR (Trm112 family)